jgi:hypothetical protein
MLRGRRPLSLLAAPKLLLGALELCLQGPLSLLAALELLLCALQLRLQGRRLRTHTYGY